IRILCGAIVVYTIAVYSFSLQDMMGQDAWVDLKLRQEMTYDRWLLAAPLRGAPSMQPARTLQQQKWIDEYRENTGLDLRVLGLRPPENQWEFDYLANYWHDFKQLPPAYVESQEEVAVIWEYQKKIHMDPRVNGLKLPKNAEEKA